MIGAEASGDLVGQQVSDKTIEHVAREIQEIDPPIFPSIERVVCGVEREAIVISVSTGTSRPYSVRGLAYKRVGNTTIEMSREEYNRLLLERLHGTQRWENEVADGWAIDELDEAILVRTVEEAIRRGRLSDPGTRDPVSLLRGLGLLRENLILRGAVVLFGRKSRIETQLPQLLLRVARFKGSDKSEFSDNRQYFGNAFRLMTLADRFLRDHLPIAGRIVPGLFERTDDPLHPPLALREALANAICHRDYSIGGGSVAVAIYDDRLEIT